VRRAISRGFRRLQAFREKIRLGDSPERTLQEHG
jgi:hypothetical protein